MEALCSNPLVASHLIQNQVPNLSRAYDKAWDDLAPGDFTNPISCQESSSWLSPSYVTSMLFLETCQPLL